MTTETPPRIRGERLSIYAGAPMQLVLGDYDEGKSPRINTVCARYLDIVAAESPTWPLAKWSAVCDALNGSWLMDDAAIRYLWATVADFDGLGKKWGIDQDALVSELRDASLAKKIAIIEIVERFWLRAELPAEQALAQAGAKISAD